MKQLTYKTCLWLWFAVCPFLAYGQNPETDYCETGWFQYTPYGKSLLADVHPNFARADMCMSTNNPSYDFGDNGSKRRGFFDGVFGYDLPIWNVNFSSQRFGISISDPMSINVWMDYFEGTTSPVVNTDYRIAAPTFTFIHRLSNSFFRNYSVTIAPFKHESTHIGDEHQIKRLEEEYPLRRVNVSYNYAETILTLNEPESKLKDFHTFRVGGMVLCQPNKGWYQVFEDAGDGNSLCVNQETVPCELYLQYQYTSKLKKRHFQGVASVEIRNRALYSYDLQSKFPMAPPKDSRITTINVFGGVILNASPKFSYFTRTALGVRIYKGNCPYGMFRSIKDYNQIGLSFIAY